MKKLEPTIKHGNGSIIVRGCFSEKMCCKYFIIEGKMDSLKYITILNDDLFKSAEDFN